MVADEQHGSLARDVVQAADVGAEVEAGQRPQSRQRLADVVGVALVEVGGGDEAADPLRDRADGGGHEPADRRAADRGDGRPSAGLGLREPAVLGHAGRVLHGAGQAAPARWSNPSPTGAGWIGREPLRRAA